MRNPRPLDYQFYNLYELAQVHLEMKVFWMRNGWTEQEAEDEYLNYVDECREPYKPPFGLQAITHSVYDQKSGNTFENLSLTVIGL